MKGPFHHSAPGGNCNHIVRPQIIKFSEINKPLYNGFITSRSTPGRVRFSYSGGGVCVCGGGGVLITVTMVTTIINIGFNQYLVNIV